MDCYALATPTPETSTVTQIELVDDFTKWEKQQTPDVFAWLSRQSFTGKPQDIAWLPNAEGAPSRVVAHWNGLSDLDALGHLSMALPEGLYQLQNHATLSDTVLAGWGLGAYQYTNHKAAERAPATLLIDPTRHKRIEDIVAAVALARDLINAPANDMLPSNLQAAFLQTAQNHGAQTQICVGDELLEAGYRTIHAVGRASIDAPRLLDLSWGDPDAPKVTLVGKGVCFDSGGLNLKPAGGMRWMKKDMGGAAIALGLAQLVMAQQLPVRLRLLIPAVENAVSGNAYRPGDIIKTYKGTTVEIDNTDAEGRLVLCDALALACEEEPDLLIDFATLTGSARSAVGAEIGAMFASQTETANAIFEQGEETDDAVWRMPLHAPYKHMLRSTVADVVNSAASPYGGAITAALFLQNFVDVEDWVHFDIMAFNTRSRPGRPEGGEAMGLRAVFAYLESRYVTA